MKDNFIYLFLKKIYKIYKIIRNFIFACKYLKPGLYFVSSKIASKQKIDLGEQRKLLLINISFKKHKYTNLCIKEGMDKIVFVCNDFAYCKIKTNKHYLFLKNKYKNTIKNCNYNLNPVIMWDDKNKIMICKTIHGRNADKNEILKYLVDKIKDADIIERSTYINQLSVNYYCSFQHSDPKNENVFIYDNQLMFIDYDRAAFRPLFYDCFKVARQKTGLDGIILFKNKYESQIKSILLAKHYIYSKDFFDKYLSIFSFFILNNSNKNDIKEIENPVRWLDNPKIDFFPITKTIIFNIYNKKFN